MKLFLLKGVELMNKSQHCCIDLWLSHGMQIVIFAIVCLAIILTPKLALASTSSFSIGSYNYYVDGQKYSMDVAPYTKDGRTYLPVRYAALALGVQDDGVIWDGQNEYITLNKGTKFVQLQIGSEIINNMGTRTTMDVVPEVVNGRAMLPVHWLAEAFEYSVGWDNNSQSVTISNEGQSPTQSQQSATGLTRDNPIPVGQSLITTDGFQVTIGQMVEGDTAWNIAYKANYFNSPPDAGYKDVLINVTVKNISSTIEPASINSGYLFLVGSSNVVYDTKCIVLNDTGTYANFPVTELFHGGSVTGTLTYQVPSGERNYVVIWNPPYMTNTNHKRYFAVQ
jgi:hypothetical protein